MLVRLLPVVLFAPLVVHGSGRVGLRSARNHAPSTIPRQRALGGWTPKSKAHLAKKEGSLLPSLSAIKPRHSVHVQAKTGDRNQGKAVQLFGDNQKRAALALLALATIFHGSGAHALDVFDEEWIRNFNVDVGGFEIDHRVLVEGVVLGQFVGFVGALVGGRAARKRQAEVEKLAKQLKDVNAKLRAKARGLRPKVARKEAKDPMYERIFGYLRLGKRTLKEGNGPSALSAFQKAMDAIAEAKAAGTFDNYLAERKAHRGMGAAYLKLENYAEALKHMNQVVALSLKNEETTGLGDAYGVIADIYTEMDDYERAAEYYDKYIEAINSDSILDESFEDEDNTPQPTVIAQ